MNEPIDPHQGGFGAGPPPAEDRLWRHPSEMAGLRPSASAPATPLASGLNTSGLSTSGDDRRFSVGTALVSGSLGALAMFAVLGALGLIAGRSVVSDAADDPSSETAAVTVAAGSALAPTAGVVTLRTVENGTTRYGAGVVANSDGDVVTTLEVSSERGGVWAQNNQGRWIAMGEATTDPLSGVTALRAPEGAGATPAKVTEVGVGQSLLVIHAESTEDTLGTSARHTTRVAATNRWIVANNQSIIGLATLHSPRPPRAADVVVDEANGSVVALVASADDNTEDELAYGVAAGRAVKIGRRLLEDGTAGHGAIPASLGVDDTGTVTVVGPTAATPNTAGAPVPTLPSGLEVGDQIRRIDGISVRSAHDCAGALLGYSAGDRVTVLVRRGTRQLSVEVTLAEQLETYLVPAAA